MKCKPSIARAGLPPCVTTLSKVAIPLGAAQFLFLRKHFSAMESLTLVDELLAKHKTSVQSSSRTLCAVLGAAVEVLRAENLEPTPPALFAATMSSLEKPAGYESSEVSFEVYCILSCRICTRRLLIQAYARFDSRLQPHFVRS